MVEEMTIDLLLKYYRHFYRKYNSVAFHNYALRFTSGVGFLLDSVTNVHVSNVFSM